MIKVALDPGAIMPTKAHEFDAGFDLYAKEDFEVTEKSEGYLNCGYAIHDTGVHIEIPEGYVGFLKSKSGLNVKHDITGEGVIDAGYTGSIVVKLYNHGKFPHKFKKGDKIIQLVILPINTDNLVLVDISDFNETERGSAGFGSSGK